MGDVKKSKAVQVEHEKQEKVAHRLEGLAEIHMKQKAKSKQDKKVHATARAHALNTAEEQIAREARHGIAQALKTNRDTMAKEKQQKSNPKETLEAMTARERSHKIQESIKVAHEHSEKARAKSHLMRGNPLPNTHQAELDALKAVNKVAGKPKPTAATKKAAAAKKSTHCKEGCCKESSCEESAKSDQTCKIADGQPQSES